MRASFECLTGHGSLLLKYACHLFCSTAIASCSGAAVRTPCDGTSLRVGVSNLHAFGQTLLQNRVSTGTQNPAPGLAPDLIKRCPTVAPCGFLNNPDCTDPRMSCLHSSTILGCRAAAMSHRRAGVSGV